MLKWLIHAVGIIALSALPAFAAVCTPGMSQNECIARQVAGRERAALHRFMRALSRELAPHCKVDVETRTGSCLLPLELFTICDSTGCAIDLDIR